MDGETVFRVDEQGGFLGEAATIRLADFSLTERGHFQEWVLAHPDIIGEDILIVTSEFDRWEDASGEPVAASRPTGFHPTSSAHSPPARQS